MMNNTKQKLKLRGILKSHNNFFLKKKRDKSKKRNILKHKAFILKNQNVSKENKPIKKSLNIIKNIEKRPKSCMYKIKRGFFFKNILRKNLKNNTGKKNDNNKIIKKDRRLLSYNHLTQRQNKFMNVMAPPKRLSHEAVNSFYNSFLGKKNQTLFMGKYFTNYQNRIKKKPTSLIKNQKKSFQIKSLTMSENRTKPKDPFTPKFSVLNKFPLSSNYNVFKICRLIFSAYAEEISLINLKFKNPIKIGKGSYCTAYQVNLKGNKTKFVLKQMKLTILSRISNLKRLMVTKK